MLSLTDKGNTALLVATRKNRTEAVAELLRHGADVSVKNRFNQCDSTPASNLQMLLWTDLISRR